VAAVAALGLGCATPSADNEPASSIESVSFESLRAREVELPPGEAIAAPDGSFQARAAGRLQAKLEKLDEGWSGTFDIGSTGPVGCLFFNESVDAATTLKLLTEGYFEEAGKTVELGERRVLSVDAGSVGPTPLLALDWFAVINGEAYQIKTKLANKGDHSIYCLHDETGYARAFEDFFSGLVDSYTGGESTPPDFREIVLVSIGEMTVGYQTTDIREDAEGDFEIDLVGSMLMPSGPGAIMASDTYHIEFAQPDGTLINQAAISSDGTHLTNLSLAYGDGSWDVGGELQGKPIEASFESESPLLSTPGEIQLLSRLAAGELAGEVSYPRWIGTVNPTAVTPHVARSVGNSSVEVEAGPLAMTADMDDRGIARATIVVGRIEMKLERVYVEGQR
jgi:hypothetical protein